jgi:branched-chain amino acid transport system ATP-binding protein
MIMLEGRAVTKNFGGLTAVSQADFAVNRDEIVGLIGPNGAGKTTLFNLISGAIKCTSGEIRFRDEDITGLRPHQICRMGLARTFQSTKLFAGLTAYENVVLGSRFGKRRALSEPDAQKEVLELLEFVGLSTAANMLAKDLPIASQKRLEVARALATKPELIMLDEVMAGLNPAEVTGAMELVARIRDKGITVFMIEHVMKAIMSVCDRIIVFHHGSKIAEGTPEEVAASPTVIEIYLGD